MTELVLATHNTGKLHEISALLSIYPVKIFSLGDFSNVDKVAETGDTFEENAIKKARYAGDKTGKLTLADDSGLEVDALNGEPGVYSARFAGEDASDAENNRKLLDKLAGVPYHKRTARFKCVIALYYWKFGTWVFEGVCEGYILNQLQGKAGFGYDPLFYYPPLGKTFAELTQEQKSAVSHRGQALYKLQQNFNKIINQVEGNYA